MLIPCPDVHQMLIPCPDVHKKMLIPCPEVHKKCLFRVQRFTKNACSGSRGPVFFFPSVNPESLIPIVDSGCRRHRGMCYTAILIIIEGLLQVLQRFSSSKLVLKTVGSRFAALNYYENGSTDKITQFFYTQLYFSHSYIHARCIHA
jgi:hypothetical protein